MTLFADDTNIFISCNNITDICNILNLEFKSKNIIVRSWSTLNDNSQRVDR